MRETWVSKQVFVTIPCHKFWAQSSKLKTGYRYVTSFKTRVSRVGLGTCVIINIFVMTYYFFSFFIFSIFFESLKSKLHKC